MIPVSLTLQGFLSYRQPVNIDFTQFELACISGANGAGKSSILDAITWVLFGKARKDDEEIINQGSDRAIVTLVFEYEGSLYRVVRTFPRGRTKVLELNIQDPDGIWKTHTEATMTDTQKSIENILRLDYETFTNASFFLQGKADEFAKRSAGDRKKILTNIIGLDQWEADRRAFLDKITFTNNRNHLLGIQRDDYLADIAREEEYQQRLDTARTEHTTVVDQLQAKNKILDGFKREEQTLALTRQQLQTRESERSGKAKNLGNWRKDLTAISEEKARNQLILDNRELIEREHQELQQAQSHLKTFDAKFVEYSALEREKLKLENRLAVVQMELKAKLAGLEQRAQLQQQASQQTPVLTEEKNRLEAQIKALDMQLSSRNELQTKLDRLNENSTKLSSSIGLNNNLIQQEYEKLERLRGTETGECPVCRKPLSPDDKAKHLAESEEKMASWTSERLKYQAEFKQNTAEIQELKAQLAQLDKVQSELNNKRTDLVLNEERLRDNKLRMESFTSEDQQALDQYRTLLNEDSFEPEIRAMLSGVATKISALGYDQAAHQSLRQVVNSAADVEQRVRDLGTAKVSIEAADKQISTLSGLIADEEAGLTRLDAELESLRAAVTQSESLAADKASLEVEINELRSSEIAKQRRVIELENNLRNLDRSREGLQEVERQIQENNKLIAQLKIIDQAYGKNGIPTMLIEETLPELEEQANSILSRLSNGIMSLRFETQRDYKTKNREDKQDTLDISIVDDLGAREYAMFSGGEAFRINFALRLALSKVLANRAGAKLQTLFIDEGFGSQDEEGRQRLIEAIKIIQNEFSKIIVITHLESLKDAFPARLDVEKTADGSTVKVVLQ